MRIRELAAIGLAAGLAILAGDVRAATFTVTKTADTFDSVCDAVLGFVEDGAITMFSDYLQWLSAVNGETDKPGEDIKVEKKKKPAGKSRKPGRLSYLDQLEYDRMEEMILAGEQGCEELEKKIEDPALAADPAKLQSIWEQLDQARREVEQLYLRWDELERKKMQ